jgi:hypothetical protein
MFDNLQVFMLAGMFILGGVTFSIGVSILLLDLWGKDLRSIISQTNRLAQKGLTEELSGLVGNASTLLNTVNEMVRTRNGIGLTLMVIGIVMMISPFILTLLY